MNTIKLAWKNLTNKPLNMALSLVLFALGVGMISMIFLIEKQVQEKFDKNLAGISLVIGAKGSPLQMILCNMYHVDDPTGNVKIQDVKPFLSGRNPLIDKAIPLSLGDSYKGFRIVGTTQDYPELYDVKVSEGKVWENNFEATIGADVAKIANLKIGDTFYSTHGKVFGKCMQTMTMRKKLLLRRHMMTTKVTTTIHMMTMLHTMGTTITTTQDMTTHMKMLLHKSH